jgi:diadenosine tetraphosphate (Ap4A) HIT family hydrolase
MSAIGDSLMAVLSPSIINYSILGNIERALHVHIHPRYETEPEDKRKNHPIIYWWLKMPTIPFDLQKDKTLMEKIKSELSNRTEILT